MALEFDYERIIRDYPNLVDSSLVSCGPGTLGAPGRYYLQQQALGSHGQLDLAFVTDDTVVLVELKKDKVDLDTLEQARRYMAALREHYPNHQIVGYLVGASCPDESAVVAAIGDEPIGFRLFGSEIPKPDHIKVCPRCGRAGWLGSKCSFCSGWEPVA